MHILQAVIADNPELIKMAKSLSRESIIDCQGTLIASQKSIESATQKHLELHVSAISIVSCAPILPLQVEDCTHNPGDTTKNQPSQDTRLNNRVLELRTPANQAIFRIQSAVCALFREFLSSRRFIEIHTPKLISCASEGGAGVFPVKYFNGEAFLAQSPQFYKQMAICSDFERVFEIGSVFRAENTNTYRHLTEFIGLDLEMTFERSYEEILDFLEGMFEFLFESLESRFARELSEIRRQFSSEPIRYRLPNGDILRLTYPEAIGLLRGASIEIGDTDDLSSEQEKLLGAIIKERHGVDFYVINKFPTAVRPFYTQPSGNPVYANAYDFFLRGEEILSGSERISDPIQLEASAKSRGISLEKIRPYLDAFQYGCSPHGGCGIGLERFVMFYLGLNNIRKTSMFPRDPTRLTP